MIVDNRFSTNWSYLVKNKQKPLLNFKLTGKSLAQNQLITILAASNKRNEFQSGTSRPSSFFPIQR